MTTKDSLDEHLVQLLERDASQTSETLAKQLNVSASTVRRRLRKLTQSGVLRFIAVVDPSKVGILLTTVIALDVTHEKLDSVTRLLASRPEVKWISITTGRFDIIIFAQFRSTYELSTFVQRELANIEGLRNSETFICLDVKKGYYTQI